MHWAPLAKALILLTAIERNMWQQSSAPIHHFRSDRGTRGQVQPATAPWMQPRHQGQPAFTARRVHGVSEKQHFRFRQQSPQRGFRGRRPLRRIEQHRRHLETTPDQVLRRLAQQIWERYQPDQVIDRADLAWVRSRWPQVQVVLSSASPKPTVEVAGEALGVDHMHYSTLDHINSGEAKIERLRELCARVGDPEVEIVGISDTSRGEDHCWAQHFTRVVDINSPTPFPAIVSSDSPLLEVHSATLLTKHERARRAAGDAAYLDQSRPKIPGGLSTPNRPNTVGVTS